MPIKLKTEDIIDALLDPRVQDAIASNTSSSISQMVEQLLTKKLDSLMRTCTELKSENAKLKCTVDSILVSIVKRSHSEGQ